MNDQDQDDNIVSLAEARRKQKVVRKGANAKASQAESGGSPLKKAGSKIGFYIQFILFLAVLAYFMQKCQGK